MHIPKGYQFAAVKAGFKHRDRLDLGLILSKSPACAAATFTKNLFQAAPVVAASSVIEKKNPVHAILANSGQANACTGSQGLENCHLTQKLLAQEFGIAQDSILTASTGVIGDQLKTDLWSKALPGLSVTPFDTPLDVAKAIMTTDTFPKIISRQIRVKGEQITLLGMAKGAGMICPDMATMLSFIVCDASVDQRWWQKALTWAVDRSFNTVTVDGDTSTNDCVFALANAGVDIELSDQARSLLKKELTILCQDLAYMIVQDAEGGTKVLSITVNGAQTKAQAEKAARAVGNSPLVKTALYGRDPNWGRIVAALGRSGANFDPNEVSVSIGQTTIFNNGTPLPGDWDSLLASTLRKDQVSIAVSLGSGPAGYSLLASDLTEEYIRINAEYRT